MANNPDDEFVRGGGPRVAGPDSTSYYSRDTNRSVSGASSYQQALFNDSDNWILRRDEAFSLFFYDSEPSLIPFTFSHGLEIIDYLEDMPFPVANAGRGSIPTNAELFEEKLERWATFIPIVTRLTFPMAQDSKQDWDNIQSIGMGDVVRLDIDAPGFEINKANWMLHKRWEYKANDVSTLEMHFLNLPHTPPGAAPDIRYNARRLRYNLRKVIYRDDGLAPRPLDLAPMWTAGGGSAFSWTINAPITETVPAVDSGFPLPTYSAAGLPVGVAFDNFTRQLTGTPTALGTGTIVITAINSLGSDTYSYDFAVGTGPAIPNWTASGRDDNLADQCRLWDCNCARSRHRLPRANLQRGGAAIGHQLRSQHAPANRHGYGFGHGHDHDHRNQQRRVGHVYLRLHRSGSACLCRCCGYGVECYIRSVQQ